MKYDKYVIFHNKQYSHKISGYDRTDRIEFSFIYLGNYLHSYNKNQNIHPLKLNQRGVIGKRSIAPQCRLYTLCICILVHNRERRHSEEHPESTSLIIYSVFRIAL